MDVLLTAIRAFLPSRLLALAAFTQGEATANWEERMMQVERVVERLDMRA